MNPYQEKRRALGHHCPSFGGDSATASTTSTEIRDMRVVGGDKSTNTSAVTETQGNNNTIITTDHGAVMGGLNLATEANRNVTDAAQNLFTGAINSANQANKQAMTFASGAIETANQASTSAISQLAGAYEKGQAGDQVALKYAAFAVVGVVALLALKK